jgi:hypothetical protein
MLIVDTVRRDANTKLPSLRVKEGSGVAAEVEGGGK